MTRQLRQRHRRVFVALSILLPLLFILGVALRPTIPKYNSLPAELSRPTITFTATPSKQ